MKEDKEAETEARIRHRELRQAAIDRAKIIEETFRDLTPANKKTVMDQAERKAGERARTRGIAWHKDTIGRSNLITRARNEILEMELDLAPIEERPRASERDYEHG